MFFCLELWSMSQLHLQLQHPLLLTGLPRWTWELIHHLALPHWISVAITDPALLTMQGTAGLHLGQCPVCVDKSLFLTHSPSWSSLALPDPYHFFSSALFSFGDLHLKAIFLLKHLVSEGGWEYLLVFLFFHQPVLLMAAMLALCHNCKGRNNVLIFGSHPSSFPACSFSVSIAI